MDKKKIYLAGGFKSQWQDKVIALLPNQIFFNPREHDIDSPSKYTIWDLDAISKSDIIIAYMEKGNPGGYALSLEIGYGKALGKKIYLIDEHDDKKRRHYFEMVREVSDVCYDTFDSFLKNISIDIRNV